MSAKTSSAPSRPEFKQGDRPAGIQALIVIPGLDEIRIAAKVITGYIYDNDHNKVEHWGSSEPLAFSIHKEDYAPGSPRDKEVRAEFPNKAVGDYVFTLNLWNLGGNVAIFSKTFVAAWNATLPPDLVALAGAAAEKFGKGIVRCSDCKADVQREKAGGHFFAGTYCVPCWEGSAGRHRGCGGWKLVESKETYS